MKKILIQLFAICIFTACVLCFSKITVRAESNVSLTQLKAKFPHGKYWNHAGSSVNNPDGYTNTPCTHHGNCSKGGTDYSGWCGCNSFGSAIQCMGFANKLAYDAYGSLPSSWPTTNLDNLKAGDVIRYKSDTHSIFVTAVNGNTITYGDCNSYGDCGIRWDKTITKGTVAASLTEVYSAPSVLSVDSVTNQAPLGNLDSFGTGNGCINLSGWAYDPDNTGATVELRIEVGSSVYTVKADQTVAGYNDGLAGHAVITSINVSERGSQNVKVWAIDTNSDNNTLIKEETLIINSDTVPIGHVDSIGGGEGVVGISGWASDADTPGENITLRLDVVGGNSYTFTTEGIGTSGYPGYSVKVPVKEFGTHEVKVYVLDQGPYKSDTKNVLIKTETITIRQRHFISYIDTYTEKIEETVGDIIGLDGMLKIEGWVQDVNGIDRVEYEILDTSQSTGGVKGVCEHRKRDDVAAENPGYPTGNEGFYAYIPYKDLRYAFYYPENMKIILTAYCNGGEIHSVGTIEINRSFPEKNGPVISNIQITDISYKGYTIKATISDESGIDRVQFPTWTLKNDQDDLFEDWGKNEKASGKIEGNTVTYRVNTSDHNNEYGTYKTHIYVYDKYGNYVSVPINESKGEIEIPERNSYIISYDANGGINAPKEQLKLEDENITLSEEVPSRLGYKFVGWKGKDKKYQPGDLYINNADNVLIAIWEEEEHSYEKTITKQPTCTDDGEALYKCSLCGKTHTETIPAKGHTEVIDEAVAATCETEGKTEGSHCSVCGKVLEEQRVIPAKGHTEVTDKAVAATCETEGKTEGSHCSVCGKELEKQEIIPAKGHSFDNGVIERPATQYEEGLKVYTCSNCGLTRTEVIAKLPVTEQEKPSNPGSGDAEKAEPEQPEEEQPQTEQPKREETKNSEKKVPVGSVLVEEKTGGVYKVLRVSGGTGEVQYMKPTGTSSTAVVPDTVTINGISYRVTEICDNAFKGNKNLRKVVIGRYVKRIGKNAFANCKRLQSVTMGSAVTVIDDKAFFKCTSLKKITIPGQIVKIGKKAFFGAKKLKTITIKTKKLTMKNVGSKAFKGIYAKAKIKVPKAKKKLYRNVLRKRGVSGRAVIK